jgi:hypothetical protein
LPVEVAVDTMVAVAAVRVVIEKSLPKVLL